MPCHKRRKTMAVCDRQDLRRFLRDNNCQEPDVKTAVRLFEPFFQMADAGHYYIGRLVYQREDKILQAIQALIAVRRIKIVTIPVRDVYERPVWASQRSCRAIVELIYNQYGDFYNFSNTVRRYRYKDYTGDFSMTDRTVTQYIYDHFGLNLKIALTSSLILYLGCYENDRFIDMIWNAIIFGLTHYLTMVILGKKELATKYEKLIRILPHTVILGNNEGKLTTWVAIELW